MSWSLEKMGFSLKHSWSINGVESAHQEKTLLGLDYDQINDNLFVHPSFNLERRTRDEKHRHAEMVDEEMVDQLVTQAMTKRDLLVAAHAIYDPPGLYLPAVSALKHI